MIHILAIAISVGAFLALAVSMKRHQRDLVGRPLPAGQARSARIAGWLLLAVAWAIEAVTQGPGLGTIVWLGTLSAGAWLAIAAINWRTGRPAR